MHIQASMGSCELAVMGLESQAISACIVKKCNFHSLMVKPIINGLSKIHCLKQRS